MAELDFRLLDTTLPYKVGGSVLEGMQDVNMLRSQQLGNESKQFDIKNALAEQEAYKQAAQGGVDVSQALMERGLGGKAAAYQKSTAEAQKMGLEGQLKQAELHRDRLNVLAGNPDDASLIKYYQNGVASGEFTPEQAQQSWAQMRDKTPDQRRQELLPQAMKMDQYTKYLTNQTQLKISQQNANIAGGHLALARDKVEAEPATQALISKAILEGRLDPNRVNSRNIKMIGATLAMDPNANLRQMGEDAASSMASNRTIGTQQANVAMAATEARDMISIAKDLSGKVDRTRYPSINAIQNAIDKGTGDENLVAFNAAINAAVNTYARAINPKGVATVDSMKHARELINSKYSAGQFGAITDVMDKELKAAQQSGEKARGVLRGQPTNIPSGAITMLKSDPSLAAQFDLKYGAGASAKVLGK